MEPEEVVEARVEGDSLPREDPAPSRRRRGGASSGKPAGDSPKSEAKTETPKAVVAKASKAAVEAAGDVYALAGTAASVVGFQAAGFVMQSQKDTAGNIIANHALANWPRLYSFLEGANKATAIVPLVLSPVMADLYMRTDNPQIETLCAGMLSQMLAGATVEIPDPSLKSGKRTVDVWPVLLQERASIVQARAEAINAEAEAQHRAAEEAAMAAAENGAGHGSEDDVPRPGGRSRYAEALGPEGFPSGD